MSPGRATLNKVVEGTRRVSKFICAGSEDSEQGMRKDTVIQGGSCVSWLCEEPARANYVHHQVASDDDMKPLDQLKSSRHLVSIMLDALKGEYRCFIGYNPKTISNSFLIWLSLSA